MITAECVLHNLYIEFDDETDMDHDDDDNDNFESADDDSSVTLGILGCIKLDRISASL